MKPARVAGSLILFLSAGCAAIERTPQDEPPAAAAAQDQAPAPEPLQTPAPRETAVATRPAQAIPRQEAPVAPATAPAPAATAAARPEAPAAKPRAKPPAPATPKQPAPTKESAAAPAPQPAAPALDLESLEKRLKDTDAIGVFTKLTLKNQVDDLLERFRAYYQGHARTTLAELRQPYDLLILKVLALLQDGDPSLASAVRASREAIWGILSNKERFLKVAG